MLRYELWNGDREPHGVPGGGGGLGSEKIDLDKFRSPPSYQIFPSSLRILCAILCTSNTGCWEGFLCATGPPIRGYPISQSQTHIPLKALPPALNPFPEATSP